MMASQQLLAQVIATELGQDAEHTLVLKFNGDFNMPEFIKHLHSLGSMGCTRGIAVEDHEEGLVHYTWDGDGADKICFAELDGKNLLE